MTEQAPRTEPLAGGKEEMLYSFPGYERPATPETGTPAVCREHAAVMDASSDVEA
jgi:hypothetical protein